MAFKIKSTLQAVESYLLASGYFGSNVAVGEPKQPVAGAELSAAIFMGSTTVAETTLTKIIEQHMVTIRIYRDMLAEPTESIEFELGEVSSDIQSDLIGDYDLGETIRNIDIAGIYGAGMGATWGYVDLGGKMYRIVDISLPLIVDDSATMAA